MARLAFGDEYVAVDVDPERVRADAPTLSVSTRAREQLADAWGPRWRTTLDDVLAEVSTV